MKEHDNDLHSLQCRRFLRARECFACESAMLKFEKRGENGLVKRSGVGGRGVPNTYPMGYYFYPL